MKSRLPPITAAQLEGIYNGVESGDSVLRFAEGASHVTQNFLSVVNLLEKIVPPIKVVISGILSIYLGYKYLQKFRKKEATKIRVFGASVNLSATVATLALSLTMIFVPVLIPLFTMIIVTLGLAREIYKLVKTSSAHIQSRRELAKISEQLEKGEEHYEAAEFKKLLDNHQELALNHIGRQWKIAHHVVDATIALLSLMALVAVLTLGPVGWIAFAAVAVTGLLCKFGLKMIQKNRLKKTQQNSESKNNLLNNSANDSKIEKNTRVLDENHHPHCTAEVVEELLLHPHHGAHIHTDHLSESEFITLVDDESKIFKRKARGRAKDAEKLILLNEDKDAEGEDEAPLK